MPLFKVSVTVEAVIQAADQKTAQLDGISALTEEIQNLNWYEIYARRVQGFDDLPFGWDPDSLVYHENQNDEDLTVSEALEHG